MLLIGMFAATAMMALPVPSFAQTQPQELELNFHTFAPVRGDLSSGSRLRLPKLGDLAIWKSDMKRAKKAWRKGDYEKARMYLEKALQGGNVKAAWYLGNLYRRGLLGSSDMARALDYYILVAQEYDPDAKPRKLNALALDSLLWIADAYRNGIEDAGIRSRPQQAYNLYMLARGHNSHGRAEFGIGVMYLNGYGVAKRPKRALRLFSHAAHRRFPPALALLGKLSWSGKYLRLDRVEGLKWYMIAARNAPAGQYREIVDQYEALKNTASLGELDAATLAADDWERLNPVKTAKQQTKIIVPAADASE